MNRKAESAVWAFLEVYGWAILAAVIAIGVLAYFGVFSPGKYSMEPPSKVEVSPTDQQLGLYRECLTSCHEMEYRIDENLSYYNLSQFGFYQKCADVCFDTIIKGDIK